MEPDTFYNTLNQIDFNKTVIAQQDVNDFIRCIQEAGMNQKQTPRSTESWDRFFGICDREIQCALRRCHFQGADLDESTQEIWLKLLLSPPRFRFNSDRAQFTTWLQTVIRVTVHGAETSGGAAWLLRLASTAAVSHWKTDRF